MEQNLFDDNLSNIQGTTYKNIYDEDIQEHYFVVTLEDVNDDEYPELLDEDIIKDYLREVAPVDYSVPFKNQVVEPSINDEYKSLLNKIGWFQISVNGDTSSTYRKDFSFGSIYERNLDYLITGQEEE